MPDFGCQVGAPDLTHTASSGSRDQRKAIKDLQGKIHAAKAELAKLVDRHTKLSACMAAECTQLRALLEAREKVASVEASPSALLGFAAASVNTPSPNAPLPLSQLSSFLDPAPANAAPSSGVSNAPPPADDGAFRARPIGYLRTPFVEKNGTPRQGCVCPSSLATLTLELGAGLNGPHSLEGLANFSHAWLIWIFHHNGNAAAKSKVTPPRVETRVGLFATRTPHRPNPIGLSLVAIERVQGHTITFSGVDLVDGTPILDLKPYVPFADGHRLDAAALRVAPWLEVKPTPDLCVEFTPTAEAQLGELAPALKIFAGDAARAKAALTEVLAADPRSVHWRNARQDLEYGFSLDKLNAVVSFEGGVARVTSIQHIDLCDRSHAGAAGGGNKGAGAEAPSVAPPVAAV